MNNLNNKNKLHLTTLTRRLLKNRIFLQNFLFLMGIQTAIFIAFALIIFFQSRNTIKQEFTSASQYKLEETASALDNHIMDMRYIIAALDTNSMVQAFFYHPDPESLYDNYYEKVQEILKAYVNGFPSIDSIYLYSQYANSIMSATSDDMRENDWMIVSPEDISSATGMYEIDNFHIFFQAKNNTYPYLLSLMKHKEIKNYPCTIIINLRLDKLAQLKEINKANYQSIYLVSDNKQILFRHRQQELTEALTNVPELSSYQEDTDFYTTLIEDSRTPYIYTQKHSSEYPWSYCMVTYLHEYSSRLSSFRAGFLAVLFSLFCAILLLSFMLSLRSIKPIQDLLHLLQNSDHSLSSDIYTNREVEYIADQMASYIQKNKTLSDELNQRLQLLNQSQMLALQSQINPHFLFNTLNMIYIQESEVLGYKHHIPTLTMGLCRLLRYAMESTDLVSLETELGFTKMYIDLLKARYCNYPQVIYNIDTNSLNAKVPKLFIQPIIENAVFHGLSKNMNENSTLTLHTHISENMCTLSIKDNGEGMSSAKLAELKHELTEISSSHNSIGLKNVVTRMKLLFGDDFSIIIESELGQGSEFILNFPVIN